MTVPPVAVLPLAEETCSALALDFEIGIASAFLEADPTCREALEMLGHALTRSGRHVDALTVDQRLVALQPHNAYSHYNLACSYSNVGRIEDALTALEMALMLGYSDFPFMETDPDLKGVRRDPRYRKLLEKGRRRR